MLYFVLIVPPFDILHYLPYSVLRKPCLHHYQCCPLRVFQHLLDSHPTKKQHSRASKFLIVLLPRIFTFLAPRNHFLALFSSCLHQQADNKEILVFCHKGPLLLIFITIPLFLPLFFFPLKLHISDLYSISRLFYLPSSHRRDCQID